MTRTKTSAKTATLEKCAQLTLVPQAHICVSEIIAADIIECGAEETEQRAQAYDGPLDGLKTFLDAMGRIKMIDGKEEIELARQIQSGDAEAKHKLVEANLRLVVNNAKKFPGRGMPLEDRIQEGCIGLMRAADKFDPKRGCKFSTSATNWIRQGITRNIIDKERPIRIPVHTDEQVQRLRKVAHDFLIREDRAPSVDELSVLCKFTQKKVIDLLEVIRDFYNIQSLDIEIQNDEDSDETTLQSKIAAPRSVQPEEVLARLQLDLHVEALLGELPHEEKQLIELHFGLADGTCHTLEQIAKLPEFAGRQTKEVYKSAINKLQDFIARYSLESELKDMAGIR